MIWRTLKSSPIFVVRKIFIFSRCITLVALKTWKTHSLIWCLCILKNAFLFSMLEWTWLCILLSNWLLHVIDPTYRYLDIIFECMWNNFTCACNIDILELIMFCFIDLTKSCHHATTSSHYIASSNVHMIEPHMIWSLMWMGFTCVNWSSCFLIWVIYTMWSSSYSCVVINFLLLSLYIWCDVSLGDDMVDDFL